MNNQNGSKFSEELLTAYALGEVSRAEVQEIENYLASNPQAKQFVEEIKETALFLKTELVQEKAPELNPFLAQKVWNHAKSHHRRPFLLRWYFQAPALGIALTIALVLVLRPNMKSTLQEVARQQKVDAIMDSAAMAPPADKTVEAPAAPATSTQSGLPPPPSSAAKADKADDISAEQGLVALKPPSSPKREAPRELAEPIINESNEVVAEKKSALKAAPLGALSGKSADGPRERFSETEDELAESPKAKSVAANKMIARSAKDASSGGLTGGGAAAGAEVGTKGRGGSISAFGRAKENAGFKATQEKELAKDSLPEKRSYEIFALVNSFNYNSPDLGDARPFSVISETTEAPWNEDHHLLRVHIRSRIPLLNASVEITFNPAVVRNFAVLGKKIQSTQSGSKLIVSFSKEDLATAKTFLVEITPVENLKLADRGDGENLKAGKAKKSKADIAAPAKALSVTTSRAVTPGHGEVLTLNVNYSDKMGSRPSEFQYSVSPNLIPLETSSFDHRWAAALAQFGLLMSKDKTDLFVHKVDSLIQSTASIMLAEAGKKGPTPADTQARTAFIVEMKNATLFLQGH